METIYALVALLGLGQLLAAASHTIINKKIKRLHELHKNLLWQIIRIKGEIGLPPFPKDPEEEDEA